MRHDRIKIDPDIMLGKPCIGGTRITVEQLLRELASGMSADDISEAHPHITPADVQAAQAYAADVLRQVWMTTQPAMLA
ncbi:MAG: DUF433 domain-containing protein [Chloroflexi bacterium]|nr:DUF433 domain-containing protein [Chloroflexota bacterium]